MRQEADVNEEESLASSGVKFGSVFLLLGTCFVDV